MKVGGDSSRAPYGRASRFSTAQERSAAVRSLITQGLADAAESFAAPDTEIDVLRELVPNMAALEAAVVLTCFMLAEGRPLNLVDPRAGDLSADRRRLEGDRTCSEHLSRELVAMGIRCTQGAFRSSTYRTSYLAEGAATRSLGRFVEWTAHADRVVEDIGEAGRFLFACLVSSRTSVAPLPTVHLDQLAYASVARWVDLVLQIQSRGAIAQYLVAALLEADLRHAGSDLTVHTKRALATDASSGAGGDVELRRHGRTVAVVEVSQGPWQVKLAQAARAGWHSNVDDVVLLASAGRMKSDDLIAHLVSVTSGIEGAREMLDVRVLDLVHELRSLIARIDRPGRHFALRRFDALLRRHELDRRPELIDLAVQAMSSAGLTDPGAAQASSQVSTVDRRPGPPHRRGRGRPSVP